LICHQLSNKFCLKLLDQNALIYLFSKNFLCLSTGTNYTERKKRHPQTGDVIKIGRKKTVKFKSFKFLRDESNDFGFDFEEFKRQNRIILQQLYDLIESSSDYEEAYEKDTV